MELQVVVPGKTGSQQTISIADQYFNRDYNEALIHQVVVSYMAAGRQGTQAQKTRAQVRGGGRKPWRQKGTGRARAGTIRSPLWRGGGIVFAATPRDYTKKVNKKMYKAAMQSIISELIRQDRLIVVESLPINEIKTKKMIELLDQLALTNVLIVTDVLDENIYYSARNIKHVDVLDALSVDPVSLIKFDKVLITKDAVKILEERVA